jgi:DNA-directed RNA polymerase subunit RPC12/RpoP
MDKYIPAPQGATNKFISSHNDSPVICASCGRRVVRKGRTQRYCSAGAVIAAVVALERPFWDGHTGAPATPINQQAISMRCNGQKRDRAPTRTPR